MAASTPVVRPKRRRAPSRVRNVKLSPRARRFAAAAAMFLVGVIATLVTMSIV